MPWYERGAGGAFDPVGPPESHSRPGFFVHDGELWLLGGTNQSAVHSYDPYTNTWTTHNPLAGNHAPAAQSAVLDGVAYYTIDGEFRSYDLATGASSILAEPAGGSARYRSMVAVGGLIYWALDLDGEGQVYDPVADSWSAITPAPTGESFGPGALATDGTYIYTFMTDPGADYVYRYDPSTDSWTTLGQDLLADDSERTINAGMAYYDGKLYMVGGSNQDGSFSSASQITHLFDIGTAAYEAFPDTNDFWTAPAIGFVDDILIVAQDSNIEVYAESPPGGETVVESTLEVTHEVSNRQLHVSHTVGWPIETMLPVSHVVQRWNADAGAVLLTTHQVIAGVDHTLRLTHEVGAPEGVASAAPSLGPVTTGDLQERVGGSISASLARHDGVHPSGGVVALEQHKVTADDQWRTYRVAWSVPDAPYGKGWSEQDGVPAATLRTPDASAPLDDTILPELVRKPILTSTGITFKVPDVEQAFLTDLEAPLGSRELASEEDCAARTPLDGWGRQTRLDLAREAAAEAGIVLVVLGNVPNAGRYVEWDYTTEGATAASVIQDMLLASGPRVWYGVGRMTVDARLFARGTGSTDPATFLEAQLQADGGASWQDQEGSDEPEPLLEDYTERCQRKDPTATPGEDAEEDVDVVGTFETFETGTYTWVERSGRRVGPFDDPHDPDDGSDWRATTHTLTKKNGELVREVATTRTQFRRDYDATINRIGITEQRTVDNEFHWACPEALVRRIELTMQRKTIETVPNVSNRVQATEDAPFTARQEQQWVFDAIPIWYVAERRIVDQRWHAEGWLRSRHETRRRLSGMIAKPTFDAEGAQNGYEVTLLYESDSRSETYLPVGRGLWHIATAVQSVVDEPVYELTNPEAVEGDADYGEMFLADVSPRRVPNHYTVVTDRAPASVSCGGGEDPEEEDPCRDPEDPYDACIKAATKRWEIDHADWEARQEHNAPKRVWSLEANRLVPGIRVGQIRGGGLVAGVTHTLDAEIASTSFEVWEWLA